MKCPCGSGEPFAECCRPLLRGEREADTALALMRSRYTAYVRRDSGYLNRTWHSRTRPGIVQTGDVAWRGLDIGTVTGGQAADATGTVRFSAHFSEADGRGGTMRETSHFAREDGRWVYVDGDTD